MDGARLAVLLLAQIGELYYSLPQLCSIKFMHNHNKAGPLRLTYLKLHFPVPTSVRIRRSFAAYKGLWFISPQVHYLHVRR